MGAAAARPDRRGAEPGRHDRRVRARADLDLAIAQRAFRVTDRAAAVDLCMGSAARAMLTVALGQAKAGHGTAVTTMLLRGLGMDFERAAEVAGRPLPPFPPLDGGPAPRPPSRGRAPSATTARAAARPATRPAASPAAAAPAGGAAGRRSPSRTQAAAAPRGARASRARG
ncbi:MAG: hypothetical protein V9G12_06990 [Microthrixaceae bacterium]